MQEKPTSHPPRNANGERLGVHHPRDKAIRGMVCGIPTFGMVCADFALSMAQQAMPINFGMQFVFPGHTHPLQMVKWDWEDHKIIHYNEWVKKFKVHKPPPPTSLEVGEARNILAQFCLDQNIEYLYFRDDDTIAPPDAINKLFSDRLAIVGGNYMSKQAPPHSLILQDGYLAGYENWRMGEIIETKNIGMGLTLIHTDVLRDIKEKIGLPWFRTVQSLPENDIQDLAPNCGRMTEDVYFCNKARACGYKIYCDTGVQGTHVDVKSWTKYFYHPGLQAGAWQDIKGNISWYPPGDHPQRRSTAEMVDSALEEREKSDPEWKRPERPIRLDLGCPGKNRTDNNGFKTVDLYEDADFKCDIRDLQTILSQVGMADELKASHILEHLPSGDIPGALKSWHRALRPGGQILIAVPDFIWAAETAFKKEHANPDEFWLAEAMVYGSQRNPGDIHLAPMCMTTLEKIVAFAGFEILDSWFEQYPDHRVQRSCVLVAKKPAPPDTPAEEVAIIQDLEEIKKARMKDIQDTADVTDEAVGLQPILTPYDPKEKCYEQRAAYYRQIAESILDRSGDGAGESPNGDALVDDHEGAPTADSQRVLEGA